MHGLKEDGRYIYRPAGVLAVDPSALGCAYLPRGVTLSRAKTQRSHAIEQSDLLAARRREPIANVLHPRVTGVSPRKSSEASVASQSTHPPELSTNAVRRMIAQHERKLAELEAPASASPPPRRSRADRSDAARSIKSGRDSDEIGRAFGVDVGRGGGVRREGSSLIFETLNRSARVPSTRHSESEVRHGASRSRYTVSPADELAFRSAFAARYAEQAPPIRREGTSLVVDAKASARAFVDRYRLPRRNA